MDTTVATRQLSDLRENLADRAKTLEEALKDEKAVFKDFTQLADGTRSLARWIPDARARVRAKSVAGTVSDQLTALTVSRHLIGQCMLANI